MQMDTFIVILGGRNPIGLARGTLLVQRKMAKEFGAFKTLTITTDGSKPTATKSITNVCRSKRLTITAMTTAMNTAIWNK